MLYYKMENEDICKLVIGALVLFGIWHFFLRDWLSKSREPEIKPPAPKPPAPKPPAPKPKKVQFKEEKKPSPNGQAPNGQAPNGQAPNGQAPSGMSVEIHFVYAEWCGHSRNAIPEFKKLVNDSSVKTPNGMPVKFIMTNESSPEMAQFKEKVQGFPTYMAILKQNGNKVAMKELETKGRNADAIKEALKSL